MSRRFDIILFGATSFVGRITARRIAEILHDKPDAFSFAIAARSKHKLAKVQLDLSQQFEGLEVEALLANSVNDEHMSELASAAKVIVSTVGPYDLYGEKLVRECALVGTHYCDLTGEPQFVHRMRKAYETDAKKSGACIVHCCGFDSIPSDIGTLFLQQQSKKKFDDLCTEVSFYLKSAKGGFSGGTAASLLNVSQAIRKDPNLGKVLSDPYAFCDPEKIDKRYRQRSINKPYYDVEKGQWLAPFLMAPINTKVVFHTAQRRTDFYPEKFYYSEAMLAGDRWRGVTKAGAITLGLGAVLAGSAVSVTRSVLENWVLPKPGEGPTEQAQEEGYFSIEIEGRVPDGRKLVVNVKGDQDPGYGSTAKMLTQSALALLDDLPEEQAGGFWTPASLIGDALLYRLPRHAGVTFELAY